MDGPHLAGSVYAIMDGHYLVGMDNAATLAENALSLTAGPFDSASTITLHFELHNFHGAGKYPFYAADTAGLKAETGDHIASAGYVNVDEMSGSQLTGTFAFQTTDGRTKRQASVGRFELFQ